MAISCIARAVKSAGSNAEPASAKLPNFACGTAVILLSGAAATLAARALSAEELHCPLV